MEMIEMSETREQRLSYVQTSEVKLVRKKHRIGMTDGTTVATLLNNLKCIPVDATVDEVDAAEDGITTITFHEESRVK